MTIDMDQFHQVFFDESEEHLDSMEALMMSIDLSSPDMECLNTIFRAAHSIKGGSSIFGFDGMSRLTHIMENLLDKARNAEVVLSKEIVNQLLQTVDVLKDLLIKYREGEEIDETIIDQEVDTLNKCIGQHVEQDSESDDDDDLEGFGLFDDDDDEEQQKVEKEEEEDDSFGFFDMEDEPAKAPIVNEAAGDSPQDNEQSDSHKADSTVSASQPKTPSKSAAVGGKSIRVDTVKVDQLVNLVGELVITQSMIALIGDTENEIDEDKLKASIGELERNTREIQEAVMSMRMLPISFVFNRFPRLVRDLSSKLNKDIELTLNGGATEVDKGLIEKLVDPLTHLVRNSIDHGVETPEKRVEAGKLPQGNVTLSAEQRGGNIEISIEDDGAGLNRDKILNKARESGLSAPDTLDDSSVWELIFAPGFSTAAEITDVSGRGVGMDVVKRNIESIGGRVQIESVQGKGSKITISLPLTLAIVDGMCVAVDEQIYVVPLVSIIESIQPSQDQLKSIANDSLLWVRDQYWPLLKLSEIMQVEDAETDPTKAIIVLLETSKKRFGLLVDRLVGQQQVVIKSLEQNFRRIDGVAGATIMGDGAVALILDIESLSAKVSSDTNRNYANE